ncbi:MAG: hypothetical protein NT062_29325 [Proteobacteria bacterium]|nr:hypothetical protein [Pseudomonadota bacterium]
MRGRFNSSITRVRPFFQALFRRDPTGESWLGALLAACPNVENLPESVRGNPGKIVDALVLTRRFKDRLQGSIDLERAFERRVAPPTAFLRYLIESPASLRWPLEKGTEKTFGDPTQGLRTHLIKGSAAERVEARIQALAELQRQGNAGSDHSWWAFEGFTDVDCYLETEKLLIFIEGKRTEALSESTHWFRGRNQLVRNLEVIGELAAGRPCGVILVGEDALDPPDAAAFDTGLPHLTIEEREQVRGRFLGATTWRAACHATGVSFDSLPVQREA